MFKISDLLKKSDKLSMLLPDIMAESAILSRNIIQGLHSTRFAGKGETFWQFKEYIFGDNTTKIDWRKSAAKNKILIKEKENEISKTIYFCYDRTKSMFFKSSKSLHSKHYFSILFTLTLCRLFLKNRENVYHFNNLNLPIKCSHDLSSFNKSFLTENKDNYFPDTSEIKDNSLMIILSDFLYETNILRSFVSKLKKKNITGYFIHILDPIELNFHIENNVILKDMETKKTIAVESNKIFQEEYSKNLNNLIKDLKLLSKSPNWNYLCFNTKDNIKLFLINLLKNLTIRK